MMNAANTHSPFGGLWIDRDDFASTLAEREKNQRLSHQIANLIRDFEREGFIILKSAATGLAVDEFQMRIKSAFSHGAADVLYQLHGSTITKNLTVPLDPLGARVVDSFVPFPEALRLFTSPLLFQFLSAIFESPPLLFQSLSFDRGSQQGLHQDTAYVVVNRPLEFAACWIALQDVRQGSGELQYIPRSHRFPDFPFRGGTKHWNSKKDGAETHQKWSAWIHEEAARRGLRVQSFLAEKGDILIWHADLVHGGAPVSDPTLSRQSLVGHFCPITARPDYFDFPRHHRVIREYQGLHYASAHYDLASFGLPMHWTRALYRRSITSLRRRLKIK